MTQFTVPGLTEKQGTKIADLLQKQLSTYNDLHLTLKHVHWNVVGPNFIGVHEMIDPQVDLVRGYADEVAERIATLGGSPQGTPGSILKDRTWDDYSVGRDTVQAHLAALDLVYNGVIEDTRRGIDETEKADPVTQDILIGHSRRAGEVPVVRARALGECRRGLNSRGRVDREEGGEVCPQQGLSGIIGPRSGYSGYPKHKEATDARDHRRHIGLVAGVRGGPHRYRTSGPLDHDRAARP